MPRASVSARPCAPVDASSARRRVPPPHESPVLPIRHEVELRKRLASRRVYAEQDRRDHAPRPWTFLTSHAVVLLHLARNPEARLRDIALATGLTERFVFDIVHDLAHEGYVEITTRGRRNRYRLHPDRPLRHRVVRDHSVGELLAALS